MNSNTLNELNGARIGGECPKFAIVEENGRPELRIAFPKDSEKLADIYQSDEYDYTVPDLKVGIDVESLYTALRLLEENPGKLHHIAAKCWGDSEGYEGKMRFERLVVTPYSCSTTYFLEFFNDWTDTLYELDLSAQMYEFFGSEPPLDRLNAVLCETGKS